MSRPSQPASEDVIVRECVRDGRPWEDPHFPPPPGETWLRPAEIFGHGNYTLFAEDGVPAGGVSLSVGHLGDGWLLGALAALAARPTLLQRLFVSVRGRDHGVYTLQIYVGEAWVPLTIDDRLPCDASGAPLCAVSGHTGELWLPLIEKAWAKLLGGYAHLSRGFLPHAFRGLTGGLPLALPLSASDDGSEQRSALTWDRLRQLVGSGA